MNELARYTGLPYDFKNHNCWQFVRRVRADYNLSTPEFDCTHPDLSDSVFIAAHDNSKGLKQIQSPERLCAVLMMKIIMGREVWHSGVYIDGMVSHCDRYARQVRLDSLESLVEQCERVEFWL